jgi:membrane protease subunit HflC
VRRWLVLLLLLATVAVAAAFCVVVIDERETGFRTLLGRPDPLGAVLIEPGLYLRIPGLHSIDIYDKRLQRFDADSQEVQFSDGRLMEVDYFVAYRIENPQLLREQLRSQERLQSFLDDNSFGPVRDALGKYPLDALLSEQRGAVIAEITREMNAKLQPRGVLVLDVRLRRTDYPEGNLPQTYQRMIKERERFARKFRAEGDEQARKLRSKADLDSQLLRAEARRQSSELRGEGDSKATSVYADAYTRDPDFYAFMRSLEAYRRSLDAETTVILSPQMPFLRYLFDKGGKRRATP